VLSNLFIPKLLGIIATVVFSFLFMSGCTNSSNPEDGVGSERLNAEVRFSLNQLTTVTNRNTYNWTNLSIIADDYYLCEISPNPTKLEPDEQVYVLICKDKKNRQLTDGFSKIKIMTDQGEVTYTR